MWHSTLPAAMPVSSDVRCESAVNSSQPCACCLGWSPSLLLVGTVTLGHSWRLVSPLSLLWFFLVCLLQNRWLADGVLISHFDWVSWLLGCGALEGRGQLQDLDCPLVFVLGRFEEEAGFGVPQCELREGWGAKQQTEAVSLSLLLRLSELQLLDPWAAAGRGSAGSSDRLHDRAGGDRV